MKILYVTHFFPPEKGAAANRAFRITKGLARKGVNVDVLTGFPNYPDGKLPSEYRFSGTKIYYTEEGVRVIRVPVQPAASADPIWFRLINQISFMVSGFLRNNLLERSYDVVVASSPPLFVGMLGFHIAKQTKAKFVFDVRDMWPESLQVLDNSVKIQVVSYPFKKLALFLYKKADMIISPVNGILRRLNSFYKIDNAKMYWLPNGIFLDDVQEFYREKREIEKIISYTGLLGRLQDVDSMIELMSYLEDFRFVVAGDGKEKEKLLSAKVPNLSYYGILSWRESMKLVSASAFAIAFLKHNELMADAIPSKVIEYVSVGTPVLMNIDTEASRILAKYGAGIVVPDGNMQKMSEIVRDVWNNRQAYIEMSRNARKMAEAVFDMEKNMGKFVHVISLILNKEKSIKCV